MLITRLPAIAAIWLRQRVKIEKRVKRLERLRRETVAEMIFGIAQGVYGRPIMRGWTGGGRDGHAAGATQLLWKRPAALLGNSRRIILPKSISR